MNTDNLENRLDFLRNVERLKDTLRNNYTSKGRTESVADHTWRLTLFAIVFADLLPGIDLLRLLKICVLHDLGEAVNGDIPAPAQIGMDSKCVKERKDFQVLTSSLPDHIQTHFIQLWDEYENVTSDEAQVAKALDKIETILQHNQGQNPHDFDFAFNLNYGKVYTDSLPLTARLRMLLDADTASKIESPQSSDVERQN